jgi:mannose-1-phosphate guanylyltransferase
MRDTWRGSSGQHRAPLILAQPESRGTAAGVLFPVHWIHTQDPNATVVVFPSDHYVDDDGAFMEHVAEVVAFLDQYPGWIVLLGAEAVHPETDYGWIEPGERVSGVADGSVRRVRQFIEKPSKEIAKTLLEKGCLWNTFVFGAQARALIETGRQCLPPLHERLARIPTFIGTEHERWAVRRAYALAPVANFSRSILSSAPHLAVSTLPGLGWCDLGTPDRALNAMARLGISLPSPEGLAVVSS